jgi:hypothetical protein
MTLTWNSEMESSIACDVKVAPLCVWSTTVIKGEARFLDEEAWRDTPSFHSKPTNLSKETFTCFLVEEF